MKWYNPRRGYGYIIGDDGREIYVHVSAINGYLREGDKVEFDIEESVRGLKARSVRKI